MKIAMWSGPRNLSTAMMYAFGARADFAVWDEPFYAPYLLETAADHPMRDQIIATHEADPLRVAERCAAAVPEGKSHFYMKHMPHHMLPAFPREWMRDCVNIHLIRHPARVVASYGAKRSEVTVDDIGYHQQADLFDQIGGLVIDSFDIRQNPERALFRLCHEIGLPFDSGMLSWPKGGRADDGVWASHWYGAIHDSTGFAGPEGPLPKVSGPLASLVDDAMGPYERLARQKLDLL